MKIKYLLLTGWLLLLVVACGPQAQQADSPADDVVTASDENQDDEQAATEEEHREEEHEEEEHEEEEHEEEAHDDDHDHEDEEAEHAEDEEHRELDAHEHGAAELTVAWAGSEIAIDLRTPAFNVVGFEYAPESEEEQALLEEALQALREGQLLSIVPEEANCALTSADVHAEMEDATEHSDEDEEGHEHDEGETHSEIEIEYNLNCENSDSIEAIDASALFARFANFEVLRAQWVSDTQQSAAELTRENTLLPLR